MIVVRVDLYSAVTGDRTLLNSVVIDNQGGTRVRRGYRVRSFKKNLEPRDALLGERKPTREAMVKGHPSEAVSVLTLLRKALEEMGY